jgi:hypothetical protein
MIRVEVSLTEAEEEVMLRHVRTRVGGGAGAAEVAQWVELAVRKLIEKVERGQR